MWYEVKDPAIEIRLALEGWTALVCSHCGDGVTVPPKSARRVECPNKCQGYLRIHDLAQPCRLCISFSDEVLANLKGME